MDAIAPEIISLLKSSNRDDQAAEMAKPVAVGGAYDSDGDSPVNKSRSRERYDQNEVSLKDGKHLEFHPGKVFNISNL